MLKDVETGKILKTKSEVSALTDFLSWLDRAKGENDGVILMCHEPQRKVLVPLLLEALCKYNLLSQFTATVKGFCNSSDAISALGNQEKITSLSLRSLCKTVLGDTSISTASATDRSRVLIDILAEVTQGEGKVVDSAKVAKYTHSVESEQEQLEMLKKVLATQGTLRPIFESQLRQKRLVREKAIELRSLIAEADLDYSALKCAHDQGDLGAKLANTKIEKDDLDSVIKLIEDHFTISQNSEAASQNKTGEGPASVKESGDS